MNFIMFASLLSFSQNSKVISASKFIEYYNQDKNDIESLINAKKAIDAASIHPKTKENPKAWYYRGLIYMNVFEISDKSNQFPEPLNIAITSYINSIEKDKKNRFLPTVIPALEILSNHSFRIGVEAFNKQDYSNALDAFTHTLKINDFINKYSDFEKIDTISLLSAGYAAYKAGKNQIAKEYYNTLVHYECPNPAIYQSLSNIYKSEGDTVQAMKTLQKGRKLNPDNKALIIDELNIYLVANKLDEVVDKLLNAILNDKTNADLYFALGTAYDNLHKQEAAKLAYQQALEINPDYFEVLYNLGAVYYNQAISVNDTMQLLNINEQKKYDTLKIKRDELLKLALPFFEKAYNINNKDQNTKLALREIYARIGEIEKSKSIK